MCDYNEDVNISRDHDVGVFFFFFFSSRRRHTRSLCDWSSDVCSSDLIRDAYGQAADSITTERLTDDRGVYRLYGLLPGTYVVSAGGASAFNGGGGGGFGGGGRGGFGGEIGRASCREGVEVEGVDVALR